MRNGSNNDVDVLLSTVGVLAIVLLLKLPELLNYVGYRLAEVWSLLRHLW